MEVEVIKETVIVKTATKRRPLTFYLICSSATILLLLALYFLMKMQFLL